MSSFYIVAEIMLFTPPFVVCALILLDYLELMDLCIEVELLWLVWFPFFKKLAKSSSV